MIAPEWEDPTGVPISAILFGGRRASAVPLVTEAFDWAHGVFLAANVASEGTAAAETKVGELRRDPFAMLPFCGYNMGDYFGHWLEVGASAPTRPSCRASTPSTGSARTPPASSSGRAMARTRRVLKWIVERLEGVARAEDTAIGRVPAAGAPGPERPDPDRRKRVSAASLGRRPQSGARRPR